MIRWKKSSRSSATNSCVEVSTVGAMRDSKNPSGPVLEFDQGQLDRFLAVVRLGRFDS